MKLSQKRAIYYSYRKKLENDIKKIEHSNYYNNEMKKLKSRYMQITFNRYIKYIKSNNIKQNDFIIY